VRARFLVAGDGTLLPVEAPPDDVPLDDVPEVARRGRRIRANFSCAACERPLIRNLPVDAERCPFCGSGEAKGFRRLFDTVQVSTRGRRVAKFVDAQLGPAYEQHGKVKDGAKRFERDAKAALTKAVELADPKTREAMDAARQGIVGRTASAKEAFGSLSPAARADSANYSWPVVNRTVVPQWQK
jgi:hypothetical protein